LCIIPLNLRTKPHITHNIRRPDEKKRERKKKPPAKERKYKKALLLKESRKKNKKSISLLSPSARVLIPRRLF
jgi:hypothetical protein